MIDHSRKTPGETKKISFVVAMGEEGAQYYVS
jgi:hypothetical protein